MSQNTLAAYRELYRARHGIACPLSDAQIRAALVSENVGEDVWPLSLAVLAAIEASVTSNFPSVDQSHYQHGGTLQAPSDLALDNESDEGFDVNFSLPTGGNSPYSIQLQIAEDNEGVAGDYADHGDPQDDNTEIVVTGLTAETKYYARLVITDNNGETATSNEDSTTTSASG